MTSDVLSDPGSSIFRPYCLSTGCVDLVEFLASQGPFRLTALLVLVPLTQGMGMLTDLIGVTLTLAVTRATEICPLTCSYLAQLTAA